MIAQTIVNEGLKSVAAGMNPMDLKRGIDKAVLATTEEIASILSRTLTKNGAGWNNLSQQ